jgi:hypothetical protein
MAKHLMISLNVHKMPFWQRFLFSVRLFFGIPSTVRTPPFASLRHGANIIDAFEI